MESNTLSRSTRIGVLIPFTNTNLEADFAYLAPQDISFHYTRIGGYELDKVPDADQMSAMGETTLDIPLKLLAGARPEIVLYGCTSATLTHGLDFDRNLAGNIETLAGVPTITAAGALVYVLDFLNVEKIGFASPYVSKINHRAISLLQQAGFESVSTAQVNEELDNYGQGGLKPDDIFELAMKADSEDAQAIVLSCTDMRSIEIVNKLEDALGKPVVTSNQAMLFNALKVLGYQHGPLNCGKLLKSL